MENSIIGIILVTLAMTGYTRLYLYQRKAIFLNSGKLFFFAFVLVADIAGTLLITVQKSSMQLSYFRIISIAAILAMILNFVFQIRLSRHSEDNTISPSLQKFFGSCFMWRCFVFVMGILFVFHRFF